MSPTSTTSPYSPSMLGLRFSPENDELSEETSLFFMLSEIKLQSLPSLRHSDDDPRQLRKKILVHNTVRAAERVERLERERWARIANGDSDEEEQDADVDEEEHEDEGEIPRVSYDQEWSSPAESSCSCPDLSPSSSSESLGLASPRLSHHSLPPLSPPSPSSTFSISPLPRTPPHADDDPFDYRPLDDSLWISTSPPPDWLDLHPETSTKHALDLPPDSSRSSVVLSSQRSAYP